VFEAMYSVMNEYGQVMGYYMTCSKALSEIEKELTAMQLRYQLMPLPLAGPSVFYTDNCCADRSVLNKIFPTLRTSHDRYEYYPILKFTGNVVVTFQCGTVYIIYIYH